MVKIGANGFEYDNLSIHATTLTRSTSTLTESSKRFQLNIDYSSTSLTGSPQIITITNTKVNAKDNILANVISGGGGHGEIFVNAFGIGDNEMKLVIKSLGPSISNTINIAVLVLT